METRRPCIAVYGSSATQESAVEYRLARTLGGELARAGADVMTGGYGGVMEACSRGAAEAGGHVIGVTVELLERRGPVNRWVAERIHTPDLHERLRILMGRADGFVVMSGGLGTLTELFLTWTMLSVGARPDAALVLLGEPWEAWLVAQERAMGVPAELIRYLQVTREPGDAARRVLAGSSARMAAGPAGGAAS